MGHDHHVHTQSDPKSLESAKFMYEKFLVWSRNFIVILAVVLALMALFLV